MLGHEDRGKYIFAVPSKKALDGPRLPPRRYLHKGPHVKVKDVVNDINETIAIMEGNVEKVIQRGEKVEVLQGKCQELETSAAVFKKSSNNSHKHMWWKQKKIMVILCLFALVALVMTFLLILYMLGILFKA